MHSRRESDGQRRVAVADICDGRLRVGLYAGRVELGHATGDQVRVRWTVPTRWGIGRSGPRFRLDAHGLRIRCRRARLRIDLPTGMTVVVRLRHGKITSWGADSDLHLAAGQGDVACRELRTRAATVRAVRVNLHFAAVPESIEVRAERAVLALPGGPYAVTVPTLAEVTVPLVEEGSPNAPRIAVSGKDVRVLAAGTPLSLTDNDCDG